MPEDAGNITGPLTQGCLECKAQRTYTIEHFTNGNTGWRCTVCGKILRLIPGKYTSTEAVEATN
jgi:transposase-like protein